MSKRFLVTGGAGFIGSAVVRHLIRDTEHRVLVIDKLTYAGNLESLASVANDPRYAFVRADIVDGKKVGKVFEEFHPDVVMHLAAESHVDRSIDGPAAFIETNIIGTYTLLEAALAYWRTSPEAERAGFRFHHVSTDEVFGSLGMDGHFTETSSLRATIAVLGVQGGFRSSGAQLVSYLRLTGADHQLFKQLRALSFS